MIHVGIYNEFQHERTDERVAAIYPEGIHEEIKRFLMEEGDMEVKTYTLDTVTDLTPEELKTLDVLLWWGHMRHADVPDEIARNVADAVLMGMGLVVLHSGHHSKPFRLLMGTTCNLSWRENGDMERLWNINPAHPIMQGIGRYFELPHEETYAERFSIPEPDEVLMIGWYEGGEVFRSACTFHRELGRIFYFQPGHEMFPTFKENNVQTIIKNAVRWVKPLYRADALVCPHVERPGASEE